MHTKLAAAALLGALATGPGIALAQTQGGTATTPALRTDDGPTSARPVPGSNSFTEGQARGRMEDAGFANVTDLAKDDQGIWRGRAVRGGAPTDVALDFQGNVFGGAAAARSTAGNAPATPRDGAPGNPPGTAAGRATDRALGTDTTGANPGGNRPDGAPGNPPSTAAGRAVDRAQGQAPQPDGTPSNPPGTAAGRAADRTLGTNATGANPATSGPAR